MSTGSSPTHSDEVPNTPPSRAGMDGPEGDSLPVLGSLPVLSGAPQGSGCSSGGCSPASPESSGASSSVSGKSKRRLPSWFKTSLPTGDTLKRYSRVKESVAGNALNTVCEEARCPNIHECWGRGTATFMVAGEQCTRGCRFCAVGTIKIPPPLDLAEPQRLADAVEPMNLDYVVITVVNRDDLPDGGADHYRQCLMSVHRRQPNLMIEFLCSDLMGNLQALDHLLEQLPLAVFAHNVECVPRLDRVVRDPRASFDQSLSILREAKRLRPDVFTKTSLMLGVGENDDDIAQSLERLREVGVELLTLGQYLAPSGKHLPVDRFVTPDEFVRWEKQAKQMGFLGVASGPLVRSSYKAETLYAEAIGSNVASVASRS